jgi:hypothetical protein
MVFYLAEKDALKEIFFNNILWVQTNIKKEWKLLRAHFADEGRMSTVVKL